MHGDAELYVPHYFFEKIIVKARIIWYIIDWLNRKCRFFRS